MDYSSKVPFQGQFRDALTLAIGALTTLGFHVAARDEQAIEFTGPGLNSTRQNALLGATRIRLEASGGQLAVQAELGGVRWLRRFVLLFPPMLCLGIGVTLVIFFTLVKPGALPRLEAAIAAILGLHMVVWMIVGPVIARRFETKCQRSLDSLIANLAAASQI
jgi:hypothetical protein